MKRIPREYLPRLLGSTRTALTNTYGSAALQTYPQAELSLVDLPGITDARISSVKNIRDKLRPGTAKRIRLTLLVRRLWPLAIQLWLGLVLVLFVWIRIFGSQAAKSFPRLH